MKEWRSSSQILFGFLPEQTVDLNGQVWRVRKWRNPIRQSNIDVTTLRRELARQAAPWAHGNDGGFVEHLHQGREVRVLSLDRSNGVELTLFPKIWICRNCDRILRALEANCPCGNRGRPGQLHFVGFHDACGALREPWIPRCRQHDAVRVVFPGTSSAKEIRFECPECQALLREGFGYPNCNCGNGRLSFNVHRSSFVYTPRSVVVVNPPSIERMRRITQAGGPSRALSWVANGMATRSVEDIPATRDALRRQLLESGISAEAAERMLDAAGDESGMQEELEVELREEVRTPAEDQAVTLALATLESRQTIGDLVEATDPVSTRGLLYRDNYGLALEEAGLEGVELIDEFPVLTGQFGYTRGDPKPGASRLVPFRDRAGNYVVYGDVAQTEALLVRLDPERVVRWLIRNDFDLNQPDSPEAARREILGNAVLPSIGGDQGNLIGIELVTLIHSFSHRFIRNAAVLAGIEPTSLSELIVPLHLSFIVYASARGDFVLGGLQAAFESELHSLLRSIVRENTRCPLDPGCLRSGGACMACLHIGEPSCRHFNTHLNRAVLFRENGYLVEG